MAKVTFDGPNKLIVADAGVTDLDVKVDLYSDWKEWVILSDNSKFLTAFSAVGGEDLPGGNFLGSTFFLENGWKIRPDEATHVLTVDGNLYARDGSDPYVDTLGAFTVRIQQKFSNLVDTVSADLGSITDAVWDKVPTTPVADSYGEKLVYALGLSKHNHRILTPAYDAEGRLLTATVRIYPTNADVGADTNHINEYDVVATYDVDGLMTSYQMKEA